MMMYKRNLRKSNRRRKSEIKKITLNEDLYEWKRIIELFVRSAANDIILYVFLNSIYEI